MDTNWTELLGKRALLKFVDGRGYLEAVVAEIAAKSGLVKFHPHGWAEPKIFELVEVLPDHDSLAEARMAAESLSEHAENLGSQLAGVIAELDDALIENKTLRDAIRDRATRLVQEREAKEAANARLEALGHKPVK